MKKYLYFIVEGDHDIAEIKTMLRAVGGQEFLNNYRDFYHDSHGDITTDEKTPEKNVIMKLNEIVINWRMGREEPFIKIATDDVERIIHIVDTDGAFIPENSIVQADVGKPQYYDQSIHCFNREKFKGRNRRKARIIRKLLDTRIIDNIPYELYFASCNMDHLLFDERNSTDENKRLNALDFRRTCKSKDDLLDSIYLESVRASDSVSASWEMIQKDYNSLAKHTNLNLLLDDLFHK